MKDSLIASHLVGGASGRNLTLAVTDDDIHAAVERASRLTDEIKRRVSSNVGRLMVAHILGGTSGVSLSEPMTATHIEAMVDVGTRVLRELERQLHVSA